MKKMVSKAHTNTKVWEADPAMMITEIPGSLTLEDPKPIPDFVDPFPAPGNFETSINSARIVMKWAGNTANETAFTIGPPINKPRDNWYMKFTAGCARIKSHLRIPMRSYAPFPEGGVLIEVVADNSYEMSLRIN